MMLHRPNNPMHPVSPTLSVSDAFVTDLLADWAEHGRETIERMRTWTPHRYLHLVATLAPREPAIAPDPTAGMSDEEVTKELTSILKLLAANGVDLMPAGDA